MSKLVPLILGLLIFFGGHIITRTGTIRARLIASVGQNTYRGLYSLVAILGLALIVHGFGTYRAAGMIPVWSPPRWMPHLVILLMWVSFILLAATFLPGVIKARAKHPMLASVKIWAFAHLLANGDLGSILLFGSFLAWAVITRIVLKRSGGGEVVPGSTMLPGTKRNDLVAILVGTLATLAFIYALHKILIGVPILGA
jgi:uncharacterized membrane protein